MKDPQLPVDALPAGITARALTAADAPQVVEVFAEVEAREPAEEHWSTAEIERELTGPTTDLARASIGCFDGDTLVGFAVVYAVRGEGVFKTYVTGGVRTAWTRKGLGRSMFDCARQQAAAWRRREAPHERGELLVWADEARRGTAALVERAGLQTWRWFFTLRRDLHDPVESPGEVEGYEIRGYRPEDAEPVRLARNAAFRDHWGSVPTPPERWAAHLIESPDFRPELSFVAVTGAGTAVPADGGEVVAFVMAEEFASDTAAHGYRTAYVALVGTVRQARGRGLATILLRLHLAAAAAAGYRYCELGVDSDSPTGAGRIYADAGFVERRRVRAFGTALD